MSVFRASAGEIDLAPPVGGWMTGFAARVSPSIGLHDPLMARAVLCDDGDTALVIVSCDLLGFTAEAVAEMRQRIAARCGLLSDNILIACTHTHSGPTTMPMRGALGHLDSAWLASAQAGIVELVCALPGRLSPARLAYATVDLPGIGYNRQDAARPVDTQLQAVGLESVDGKVIATLVNYATHAVVLGPGNLLYSGDFPGATARHLRRLRGGLGLYLQGTSGDVDPQVFRERGWGLGSFDDCERIGERLAGAAAAALADAPRTTDMRLHVLREQLGVPLDPPPSPDALDRLVAGFEADLVQARGEPRDAVREGIALAMLSWAAELRQAMNAHAVPEVQRAELFVARIGELWLVALPFELYSDIGLRIKHGMSPLPASVVGYANGLYGYCASRWAKEQGGYGPDAACRWFPGMMTPIGTGADELLVHAVLTATASTHIMAARPG